MSAGRSNPRVLSIPPGVAFLPTFAQALLQGRVIEDLRASDDPLALASATIYVPTRRAARALAVEIARLLPGPSAILPRIVPLGQMEQIEAGLLLDDSEAFRSLESPLSISDMQRRAVLARLVLEWSRQLRGAIVSVGDDGALKIDEDEAPLVGSSMMQAWRLAADLAALIDEMIIEDIRWSALDTLVPAELDFDKYWGITLDFLKIAIGLWPEHLKSNGLVDAAARQKLLIEAEAARLERGDSTEPVIALGSTGTNRATAKLLAAIAHAPRGAVVLPGLDAHLDDASWRAIAGDETAKSEAVATHPQAALRRLLPALKVEREAVAHLEQPSDALWLRARLVSEAMRPADTTEAWGALAQTLPAGDVSRALADVTMIEAADEREEALALAIRIREALEHPDTTVALATPDRALARRVRSELLRWGVEVDDSGGESLGATAPGALARLIIACARTASGFADVLALMSHRMARFNRGAGDALRLARQFDIAVFRQTVGGRDKTFATLAAEARPTKSELVYAHPAVRALLDDDWTELTDFGAAVDSILAPLKQKDSRRRLSGWIEEHRRAFALALESFDPQGAQEIEALQTLLQLFDETRNDCAALDEPIDADDYAAFFDQLSQETIVRGPRRAHPRLKILGLLEARLMDADVILLGGLDEAVWPPSAQTDVFLNRPMRAMLGLSPPERRIGQTAHDFTMAMGAQRVVISRARKRDGAPTVRSRFLQRLHAVAGDAEWSRCVSRGETWRSLAEAIDRPADKIRIDPPQPKPDLDLRPTRLSVTRIETLRRDPYSIYAEKILELAPLDGLDVDEGPRETGTQMHAVIAAWCEAHPNGQPILDATEELRRLARIAFATRLDDAEFRTFQWRRIEVTLAAFARWDHGRRESIRTLLFEKAGVLQFDLKDGSPFTLTARADRIESLTDSSIVIFDFKTGTPPSLNEIKVGFAPQLTLEAEMTARGAFGFEPQPGAAIEAVYLKLLGREGVDPIEVKVKDRPFDELVGEHVEGMMKLLNQFRRPDTPYLSRPYVKFINRYSAYDHLARVKEWGSNSGSGE